MTILELISDEAHWVKAKMATNIAGDPVAFNSPFAVRFCLLGAVMRIYTDLVVRKVVYDKLEASMLKLFPNRTLFIKWSYISLSSRIHLFNDSDKTSYKDLVNVVTDASL